MNNLNANALAIGEWSGEIKRADGNIELIPLFKNQLFVAGKNAWEDVMFRSGTQSANWFAGLINNSGFTAYDFTNDTIASHAGWSEYTGYSEATRVAWGPNAASGGIIANTTLIQYNFTATAAIKGAFIVSNSTKGGTTGTMFSAGSFGSVQNLNNGDVLRVIYSLTLAG